MQFMHGHLTRNDVIKSSDKYYIFSNLFWSYRPEYYDAVFHLWGSLKTAYKLMRELTLPQKTVYVTGSEQYSDLQHNDCSTIDLTLKPLIHSFCLPV